MLLGEDRRRGEAATPASAPHAVLDFDAVYAEHAGFVCRVLRGMGLPDAQLDDAVQDVFLVVHRRLGEFDGQAKVRTWLFGIALRVASHHRRRAKRARDHIPVADTLSSDARSPLDSQLPRSRATDLRRSNPRRFRAREGERTYGPRGFQVEPL